MKPRTALLAGFVCVLFLLVRPARTFASVSFRNEVMAVLSKAGCNAGGCHGNASGKAGFKLSLRGEDPEWDYTALVRDMFGRRVNPTTPEESLILLKATTTIAHEGGQRFQRASPEYEILQAWITAGAPHDIASAPHLTKLSVEPRSQVLYEPVSEAALKATAHFDDGSSRDVTGLAVFTSANAQMEMGMDGTVRSSMPGETTVIVRYLDHQQSARLAFVPSRPGFQWSDPPPVNFIDELVFAKLKTFRMNPSETIGDRQFIRRAYLDLLGKLPTRSEAEAFIQDSREDKRSHLIDALLERPEFADYWALKWADVLRVEEKALDRKGVELFHRWIRESIAESKPLDQFAREILTARGSTYDNPPANYYRSNRQPVVRGETTAQVFLGTRLQCAQCHNHPYDRWTQNDYFDWAGVFARIDYKVLENRYADGLDKHGFKGEQIVFVSTEGEVTHPKTKMSAKPRFLGETEHVTTDENRLKAMADWLTGPDNRQFAQVQANRIWYHLMGRGLVHPIDDFRATNPATHPELLDRLADELVASGFDLRHLIRTIMNSKTHQASSLPNETNVDDETNYSRYLVRRLDAEPLLDAISQVMGAPLAFTGYPEGMRACEIPGVRALMLRRNRPTANDQFLTVFGKPERLLATEEERSCATNLGQVFQLMTGPAIHELISREENRIALLAKSGRNPGELLEDLYWSALTRAPTDEERAKLQNYLLSATDLRAALEDVAWALLNSKEFVMKH